MNDAPVKVMVGEPPRPITKHVLCGNKCGAVGNKCGAVTRAALHTSKPNDEWTWEGDCEKCGRPIPPVPLTPGEELYITNPHLRGVL